MTESVLPNFGINFTKMLCTEVKNYPLLYDKKHSLYYNSKERERVFQKIADKVCSKFNVYVDSKEIRTRWESIRKYFAKTEHKGTEYFLSKDLSYLLPHLKNGNSIVTNKENQEACNVVRDEGYEDLTYEDVLQLDTDFIHKPVFPIKKIINPEMKSRSKGSAENTKSIKLHNKIVPPINKKNQYESQKIEKLEEKRMQVVEAAMDGIQNLLQSETDDYEDFLTGIKQSLSYIPNEHLLDCTNGILNIIDKFIVQD